MSTTVEPTDTVVSRSKMVEVLLNEPDDFLKVRETLTRIGVASRKRRNSINHATSCISKEDILSSILRNCFALDGKHANLINDVQRRNRIAKLMLRLADWGLITIVKPDSVMDIAPLESNQGACI